jgi:hypothetical protein
VTIALECGHGSIGPFNRAFRQHPESSTSSARRGLHFSRDVPYTLPVSFPTVLTRRAKSGRR